MFALTRATLILQPCWQLCKAEGLIVKRSCFTDKPKCWTDWHFSVWGQQDHKDHECQHQIAVCICISLWTINVSCWWWQRKSRGNTKVRRLYSVETIQVKYHQSVLLDWLNIFSIWVSTCSALGCQTGYKHEFYEFYFFLKTYNGLFSQWTFWPVVVLKAHVSRTVTIPVFECDSEPACTTPRPLNWSS